MNKDKDILDIVLLGAGAMSTTLGTLLNQLDPSLKIMMLERLESIAQESTDCMNNAGTGHAGYCELNYTPQDEDGEVNIEKALEINAAFEISLQFWSYLSETGILPVPEKFINPVPHQSFVWGEENVLFLKQRYKSLKKHHFFADMEFSDSPDIISSWLPLVMEGRDLNEPVAATRVAYGSDVNFGKIARGMSDYLTNQDNFSLKLNTQVLDLKQADDKSWQITCEDLKSGKKQVYHSRFVFLGLGGGSLPLLQKSEIPEAEGYAGFPVSGHWLVCKEPEIVNCHTAKVYGKAPVGAPPMSVPHLDTRILDDGQKALLFGPFAGFTTKFLKYGSSFDLIKSTTLDNIKPMAMVGMRNLDLTRYLIKESWSSHSERISSLQVYYPLVNEKNWKLESAGQRVQIIKRCDDKGGKLEFGTEVVTSRDKTLAALLGASPGASITTKTMIDIIQQCFADRLKSNEWQKKIKKMVPSYGESLLDNKNLHKQVRERTLATLKLN